jgi:hypothetical protein
MSAVLVLVATAAAEALSSLRFASRPVAAATRSRHRFALCRIFDLPEDCDAAQVAAAATAIGSPSGSVEQQQAEVIAYLVRRLQLEDDVAEREKEWLYTIQVAGDLGRAGELLEEKETLQATLDEYSVREADVAAAVAARDELKMRVVEGERAAADAEVELGRLREECGGMEADLAARQADKVLKQLRVALHDTHRQTRADGLVREVRRWEGGEKEL